MHSRDLRWECRVRAPRHGSQPLVIRGPENYRSVGPDRASVRPVLTHISSIMCERSEAIAGTSEIRVLSVNNLKEELGFTSVRDYPHLHTDCVAHRMGCSTRTASAEARSGRRGRTRDAPPPAASQEA